MKRIYPFTALLFIYLSAYSQLTVKPFEGENSDNYIFVKESVLFVSEDVHLNKNHDPENEASIYLRNGAQLIQGKEQRSPNTGSGMISVFQTGTSNAYDYDYWAAPVGNSVDKNGFFGISMLYAPKTETNSVPAQNSSALNGTADPLNISSHWIYTYSGYDYFSWHFIGNTTAIPAGYGFSMKGVDGKDPTMLEGRENNSGNSQRYDFRGRPNSGNIEVPVSPEEIVLVGNPYPSALNLSYFLLENSGEGSLYSDCYGMIERKNAITGIAYFWDSIEDGNSHYLEDYIGGYGAFSPVDICTTGIYEAPIFISYGITERETGMKGKHQDRRFLPIAQGFMVQGADNSPLVFKNNHRAFVNDKENPGLKQANKNNTKDLKVIPKIRLQVTINDEYVRGLSLGFWPAASNGVDSGMDAKAYDMAPADVGWLQGEESYIIDVRPFEESEEIPLFLEVDHENATFRFSTGGSENFEIKNIFILDKQTNTYHSIKEEAFEIELPPGNYNERFKLAFVEEMGVDDIPIILSPNEPEEGGFSIFQNNYMGELEIISNSFIQVRSVGIYDLHGKRVFFRSNFENKRSISISTQYLANAVYLVKVIDTNNQSKSKKIAVLNAN